MTSESDSASATKDVDPGAQPPATTARSACAGQARHRIMNARAALFICRQGLANGAVEVNPMSSLG